MKYIFLFAIFLFATTLLAAPAPLPKPSWGKEGTLVNVYFIDDKGMQITKEDTDKKPVSLFLYVWKEDSYLSYKCDLNVKVTINDKSVSSRDLVSAWDFHRELQSNQEDARQVTWKAKIKSFKDKNLELKITMK